MALKKSLRRRRTRLEDQLLSVEPNRRPSRAKECATRILKQCSWSPSRSQQIPLEGRGDFEVLTDIW